jgi:hypothetical protein
MARYTIYKPIILPFSSNGCETRYVTQKKCHKLQLFGSKALRKISEPKKDELIEQFTILHNKELIDLTGHVTYFFGVYFGRFAISSAEPSISAIIRTLVA